MTDIFPPTRLSEKFLFQDTSVGGNMGMCWWELIFPPTWEKKQVYSSNPTTNLPTRQHKRRKQKCLHSRTRTYMFGWLVTLELELQVIVTATADNNISHQTVKSSVFLFVCVFVFNMLESQQEALCFVLFYLFFFTFHRNLQSQKLLSESYPYSCRKLDYIRLRQTTKNTSVLVKYIFFKKIISVNFQLLKMLRKSASTRQCWVLLPCLVFSCWLDSCFWIFYVSV